MTETFKQTQLVVALKRITLCATTTALLTGAGMAQAIEVKVGDCLNTVVLNGTRACSISINNRARLKPPACGRFANPFITRRLVVGEPTRNF